MLNDGNRKDDICVPIKTFQESFLVAYATTVHKLQGSTINEPFTIYEYEKMDKRYKVG